MSKNAQELLKTEDLKKWYPIRSGKIGKVQYVKALDGVSIKIMKGETYGVVGESGCGKTTLSRVIMGLEKKTGGDVFYHGEGMLSNQHVEYNKVQMVFQDPYSSLNPKIRIGDSIAEPLKLSHYGTKKEIQSRVEELLDTVGLSAAQYHRFPHEFSGGQRQRIGIARALAMNPELLICDEPVSALDVSIRSQILNLLADLKEQYHLTTLFISHDLSVVEYICDQVCVMYLGKVMEIARVDELYKNAKHPYTRVLLSAIPRMDPRMRSEKVPLEGEVPTPINPPPGCRFSTRCPHATEKCRSEEPILKKISDKHLLACHYDL